MSDVGNTFDVTLTIEDDYGYSATCVIQVTVAGEETVYQGGGNWSNGLPDIGSTAKISIADYNTSTAGNDNFSACSCEIDANRTLTVGADNYIEIENDIVVDGTLIVKHTGNVVQAWQVPKYKRDLKALLMLKLPHQCFKQETLWY